MNLKEAFRFQNKLQALMEEVQDFLSRDDNVTLVENTYLYKKVVPEAENETVVDTAPTEYTERVTEMVRFLMYLMAEREKLSKAIQDAKRALPIDMDREVSLNSKRQEIAWILNHMADLRNSEVMMPGGGTGYRFNQEGNQVPYRCDVKRVTTIHFDRKVIRNFARQMNKKSDLISAELDGCLINSKVDYQKPFDVNDSPAEIFEAFVGSLGAV